MIRMVGGGSVCRSRVIPDVPTTADAALDEALGRALADLGVAY